MQNTRTSVVVALFPNAWSAVGESASARSVRPRRDRWRATTTSAVATAIPTAT
jgi:hypothetical protein